MSATASSNTSIPGLIAERRVDGLNTLRAIAIVLVFVYHYMVFVSRAPTFGWASELGWVGVDLFFVLSGYLIANQLFAGMTRGQTVSLRRFYIRRALRTLPNFWVVLALYFLLPTLMGGREPPPLWRFLTFTQNWQLPPGTAFSHAWSLCIEEQFYVLLPIIVVLAARYGRSVRLAWLLLAAGIAAGIATRSVLWIEYGRDAGGAVAGYHPNVYYSSFCRMDEFLPGVAVALLKNFHRELWQRVLLHGQALLWTGLAACAAMGWGLYQHYYIDGYGYGYFMTGFGYSLIAVCFALLVVAALSTRSLLHRVRVPGAAQLAAWSYAIYLTHKAVGHILAQQLEARGIAAGSLPAVVLITVASLAAGWLLYRLVETPFMNLRDRYFPSNFAATAVPRSGRAVPG